MRTTTRVLARWRLRVCVRVCAQELSLAARKMEEDAEPEERGGGGGAAKDDSDDLGM